MVLMLSAAGTAKQHHGIICGEPAAMWDRRFTFPGDWSGLLVQLVTCSRPVSCTPKGTLAAALSTAGSDQPSDDPSFQQCGFFDPCLPCCIFKSTAWWMCWAVHAWGKGVSFEVTWEVQPWGKNPQGTLKTPLQHIMLWFSFCACLCHSREILPQANTQLKGLHISDKNMACTTCPTFLSALVCCLVCEYHCFILL